jgi:hypothetical protein
MKNKAIQDLYTPKTTATAQSPPNTGIGETPLLSLMRFFNRKKLHKKIIIEGNINMPVKIIFELGDMN